MLPELPLPGPLPGPSSSAGSNVLFHPKVQDEAHRVLSAQDHHLALRLAHAISAASEPYLDLVEPSAAASHPGPGHYPLVQQVLAQRGGNQQQYGHGAQQQQQQHPGQDAGSGYGGWQGGGQAGDPRHHGRAAQPAADHRNGHGGNSSGSEHGAASPATAKYGGYQHAQQQQQLGQQQQQQGGYKIPRQSGDADTPGVKKNFKIDVNTLSKEHQDMMQKSLKELKFGENTNYNSYSPRVKKKEKSYRDRSDSESSEDEDGNPKTKSKFFKHTEKERMDEKQKRKEERRKRREEEGDDYEPGDEDRGRKRRHGDDSGSEAEDDSWLKRRRLHEPEAAPAPSDLDNFVPKKVTREIKKKYLPEARKLDSDEILESSNFVKFNRTMEVIFETAEEVNMTELADDDDDGKEIPSELLVQNYMASTLAGESAKLKSMSAMEQIPTDRLVKLLSILSWNIKDGSKVIPIALGDDDDEEEEHDKLFLELASSRVLRAAECAICAMNILTSPNMSKKVYLEDVIDRIAVFIRYQLQKTIYPSFDPVYKEISKNKDAYLGSMKKKRNYAPTVRDRKILNLYNRCNEIVCLLSDLIHIQRLTDTTVLHLSSMGVAPFFVENIPEIQLSALKLTTGVFSKYDKHRKLVLDDILASIARLPQTKRSLRTFRLNREENIQMLTALVMQLIQCVVTLPESMGKPKGEKKKKKQDADGHDEEEEVIVDRDVHVNNLYESAMATAVQFLTVFLKKCGSRSEDVDYRPLFENFLQDLLTTVNTPEWPAAELLLSLLGKMLVGKFSNKQTEVALRISSLEYLGEVAARLRKDAVQSKLKLDTIDSIIQTVKDAEEEDGEMEDDDFEKLDPEEKRTRFLQRVLLDYLAVTGGEVRSVFKLFYQDLGVIQLLG